MSVGPLDPAETCGFPGVDDDGRIILCAYPPHGIGPHSHDRRPALEYPLAGGEITHIEYDDKSRITAIHVRDPRDRARSVIRIGYPEPDLEIFAGPEPVFAYVRPSTRPQVTVARLV